MSVNTQYNLVAKTANQAYQDAVNAFENLAGGEEEVGSIAHDNKQLRTAYDTFTKFDKTAAVDSTVIPKAKTWEELKAELTDLTGLQMKGQLKLPEKIEAARTSALAAIAVLKEKHKFLNDAMTPGTQEVEAGRLRERAHLIQSGIIQVAKKGEELTLEQALARLDEKTKPKEDCTKQDVAAIVQNQGKLGDLVLKMDTEFTKAKALLGEALFKLAEADGKTGVKAKGLYEGSKDYLPGAYQNHYDAALAALAPKVEAASSSSTAAPEKAETPAVVLLGAKPAEALSFATVAKRASPEPVKKAV